MWCPPTPPQDDNDLYVDHSLTFLYDTSDIIPEAELPPVYIKKDYKRSRSEAGFYPDGRRPPKIRREDTYYAPRSLFDRPTPQMAKLRKEYKLQRYKGIIKPFPPMLAMKPTTLPMKPPVEPEGGIPEWTVYEDMAILNVIQNLQGLPLNLMLISPGHVPNWDLVADIVNQSSRTYRLPKQCRYRYESVIMPREEGKLLESPKKQKKNKNPQKQSPTTSSSSPPPPPSSNPAAGSSPPKQIRSMRTGQLYTSDANSSFIKLMRQKFENIRTAFGKKPVPGKSSLSSTLPAALKNPKHALVLAKHGQPTTIVVCGVSTNATPTVATIVQAGRVGQPVVNICASPSQQQQQQQQTQQIVKAIVASPASQNLLSQQLAQVAAQQSGNAQQQVGQAGQTQQVSVVLTTPVTTMSGVNSVQLTSQPQIVSIHQPASSQQLLQGGGTATISPASQATSIVNQSIPHVVSVAQLGSVMTSGVASSATIQPAQVTTLTTSALRAQRIVAPTGTLQEVVLHQRSGSQSPTVVSVSSLGGGLTQAQLQSAQLRLSMAGGQQVSGVVAKSISVGTVSSTGKPGNAPQIQFYRQPPMRQSVKVLHPATAAQVATSGGATVLQTASGQQTIVSPAILQGNIIQTGTVGQTVQVQQATAAGATGTATAGTAVVQKVSGVTTVTGGNAVTQVVSATGGTIVSQTPTVTGAAGSTIATVQMVQGQPRMQYIKQLGGTKHMITRPATDNEMQLMVKRQLISQQQQQQQQAAHNKQQLIPQAQLFAQAANLQVQQAGTSGAQQMTLVKTSGGTVAATGMTLSQVKPGQLKTIGANQGQVRQVHLQQQILTQQRKGAAPGKMTQITHVAGKTVQPTQVFLQGPKNIASGTTMTMQQVQHVIRHTHQGSQIVLGKTGVSRMIPVSMSQSQGRQAIQVVSATSAAQAIAAGNIRTHVPGQNIGTIKVAGGATSAQQQQVILNAIQSQQAARSNASPVRLQTTPGGSLVAVTVQSPQQLQQQQQQQQQVVVGTSVTSTPNVVSQTVVGGSGSTDSSPSTAAGGSGAGGSSGGPAAQVGTTVQQQQVLAMQQQQQATAQQTAQQHITVSSSATVGDGGVTVSTASAGPAATQVSSAAVVVSSAASSGSNTGAGATSATQPGQQASQVSMIKKKQSPNIAK
uniref:Myb-like domain-containing protein n=1 Tax=Anopheles quadriannulatus TaxID=34691 RepID=A0A182XPB5_ANOQN